MISRQLRRVVLLWAIWSAGIALLATLATHLPAGPAEADWRHEPMRSYRPVPLARWDAGWYSIIAREGYSFDAARSPNTIGFYPLYPLLLRAASAALPFFSVYSVGVFLSLLFLLGALTLIARLAAAWGGCSATFGTTAAILLFPTSFFLASVYTESLFLLATAAAFWGARNDRWLLAGAAGAAAGLTRFNGALILLPLAGIAWATAGRNWRLAPRQWSALGLALSGAAAYPIYLWSRFGDPLLYVREKSGPSWSTHPGPPWESGRTIAATVWRSLHDSSEPRRLLVLAGFGFLLGFFILSVLLVRRGLVVEGLYCAATLLLLVSSGTLEGMIRYVLALFPCFFLIGEWLRRSPTFCFAYALGGVGLGMVLLHRFVHLVYVG